MSDQQPVEVVIDELVLDGVAADMVPPLVRAIEQTLAGVAEIRAGEIAGLVSDAVADTLRTGRRG
jgi:hypothetical protein